MTHNCKQTNTNVNKFCKVFSSLFSKYLSIIMNPLTYVFSVKHFFIGDKAMLCVAMLVPVFQIVSGDLEL